MFLNNDLCLVISFTVSKRTDMSFASRIQGCPDAEGPTPEADFRRVSSLSSRRLFSADEGLSRPGLEADVLGDSSMRWVGGECIESYLLLYRITLMKLYMITSIRGDVFSYYLCIGRGGGVRLLSRGWLPQDRRLFSELQTRLVDASHVVLWREGAEGPLYRAQSWGRNQLSESEECIFTVEGWQSRLTSTGQTAGSAPHGHRLRKREFTATGIVTPNLSWTLLFSCLSGHAIKLQLGSLPRSRM